MWNESRKHAFDANVAENPMEKPNMASRKKKKNQLKHRTNPKKIHRSHATDFRRRHAFHRAPKRNNTILNIEPDHLSSWERTQRTVQRNQTVVTKQQLQRAGHGISL
jgi:hypothetical protein